MIQRLVTMPTMPESETLGGLFHDDNNGFDSGGKICPPSARLALRNSDTLRFVGTGAYWPNGVVGLENQAYFNDPLAKIKFLRTN